MSNLGYQLTVTECLRVPEALAKLQQFRSVRDEARQVDHLHEFGANRICSKCGISEREYRSQDFVNAPTFAMCDGRIIW
jgi:hypothetical protein